MTRQTTTELLAERGALYGDAVETHARIASVWGAILGRTVSAHQVALCMIGLKLIRADCAPTHTDSHDDIQGYAEIAKQIASVWEDS